ncbi:hypothetical protein PIB30_021195 [Stylosanthes scabra]|uniref:Uncharacterized protein n=1 Tax=Stylosanthes scabra TaxID=79078 RepID=A0ABU6U7S7_9FABA|nr:hypothetical protein [Stylosanthes scabra]
MGVPFSFHRLKPRLVAGTLAGGPPTTTVSRDVSSCPTWKQEPHRHLLLLMEVDRLIPLIKFLIFKNLRRSESIRVSLESIRPIVQSKSSSRLTRTTNRFEKSLLAYVQKRIGSTLIQVDSVYLFNRFLRKPSSRIDSEEMRIDLREAFHSLFKNESVRLIWGRELRVAGDSAAIGAPIQTIGIVLHYANHAKMQRFREPGEGCGGRRLFTALTAPRRTLELEWKGLSLEK